MPDSWLSSQLRYGLSPEEYQERESNIRRAGFPRPLQELAKGNPNIEDRFIGQMIATEQGRPELATSFFNKIAFGDPFLQGDESERTKAAGDLGRNMALARQREAEPHEHAPDEGFFSFWRR